jgi:hypothetical protein
MRAQQGIDEEVDQRRPGYPDLREPYLHIGNLGVDGIRLTDLAARAQLSPATASELVSDLQALGYLERRANGTNKRAKLIFPDPPRPSGARRRRRPGRPDRGAWSQIVGPECFADTCRTRGQRVLPVPSLIPGAGTSLTTRPVAFQHCRRPQGGLLAGACGR